MIWKLKRIVVITMLLASMLFVFNTSVEAGPGGNVTISNVSPVNASIANEIVNNPPEWAGYVNLSFTLTDSDSGNNMEFYLNVSVNGTWINRLHLTSQDSGSWYQHEDSMNHTNSTYYWNVSYRDGAAPFKTELYHFRSEAKPDPPDTPTPTNGSNHLYGNVTLSCVVHHPDAGSAPPMNVTFYEWPSGRTIGYDNSSLSDGNTATCDTSYYCPYNGTKYYWYAVTRDDEFNSNNSDIWYVETYYNDTEPSEIWYAAGGDIYVEPAYVETEPNTIWYTLGGEAGVYSVATFNNPVPADDATNQWISLILSIDVNTTTPKYMDFRIRPSGAGAYGVEHNASGAATNWDCINETTADDDTTYIYNDKNANYDFDLYSLPNHTFAQHGDQLNVTLYYRVKNNTRPECNGTGPGTAIAKIRTYDTNYTLDPLTVPESWTTYNYTWDLNPNTGLEWTWTEIDDLQAGIDTVGSMCTQLYINVHYRQSITLLTTQFYTNDTVDGSWVQIGSDIPEQRTNYTATMGFSGLQFNKDYWWRARVYNTTVKQDQNSSDYHFTTMSPPSEPSMVFYSLGGTIWVEPVYIEPEPSMVWYTLGGNITVTHMVNFANESPPSSSTDLWHNVLLSAWAYKGGDPVHYDFTFYTNDTADGSWASIGTLTNGLPNLTVSTGFSGLEFNKTYWWKVIGVNETLGTTRSSDIWYFQTMNPPPGPNTSWYTMGGDIWVEPPYIEPEPTMVWYTLGGNVSIGAPYKPTDPIPPNGTIAGKHIYPEFSCYVADPQGYRMNVSFYWINGTLIGTDTYVNSGTRASVTVGELTNYTWHRWYAVANNSPDANSLETRSDTWWYLPGNQVPTGNFTPWEGATYVAVRRKLVGGTYQFFVRLIWNITDVEGDDIEFNCFVDDPAIGNWNDWISRWHITDATNGTYYHDETLFSSPLASYTWRMYLADIYNSTNHYMNFTSEFYFFAAFNFTPYRATNNDTVLFIDRSENATDYWWYVNGVLIANASGLNATDQFNTTHVFNISNVYNVTLVVHNESADVTDSVARYIYIDRNLSLNRSDVSAITYYGQSPNGSTNASNLCSLLGITSNAWVHKYNTTTGWQSFWIDFPSLTTDFNISLWDALAIVIGADVNKRINITEDPDQREAFFSRVTALENMSNATQILTLPEGYNFICWSNITATTSYNISIGLVAAQDRVYKYNTQTGDWSVYWYGVSGSDYSIESYDILVLSLGVAKTIMIGDGFS